MQRFVMVWTVLSIVGAAPVAAQEAGWLSGVVTDREMGGRLGGAVVSIIEPTANSGMLQASRT